MNTSRGPRLSQRMKPAAGIPAAAQPARESVADGAERDVKAGQGHGRRVPFQVTGPRRVGEPARPTRHGFSTLKFNHAADEIDTALTGKRGVQLVAIGSHVRDPAI